MQNPPLPSNILSILLKDRTTGKNILWATDNYRRYGAAYESDRQILSELISRDNGIIIRPRVEKSKAEQQKRVRDKAEVFTPSWVCNLQNNCVEEQWFERKEVFNIETDKSWQTITQPVTFPDDPHKTWQDYIRLNVLEITCGEAPYLSSRYDTVTGQTIDVPNRIGLLDRKLRIISENTETAEDWLIWATVALQSTYGFEWQGDNILIARENLFYDVQEHFAARFADTIPLERQESFAKIISWNIWQMDGLKFVIPNSCHLEEHKQKDTVLFEGFLDEEPAQDMCRGCKSGNRLLHNGIYCKIKDWKINKTLRFVDMLKG
ncbi:MAG: restriction endonuclease subunit M [Spirochaetales bacterium]|nr:restriction endonuclease subunit M [Spirochaetales bacterium]